MASSSQLPTSEIPKYMKALVKESATESYIYKDVLVPQPGVGELLVKVKKVAICGSDITLYKWGESKGNIFALFKIFIMQLQRLLQQFHLHQVMRQWEK